MQYIVTGSLENSDQLIQNESSVANIIKEKHQNMDYSKFTDFVICYFWHLCNAY